MKKLSVGLFAIAGTCLLSSGVATAATPVSAAQVASTCVVSHGSKSGRTWTEYFTHNCAYLQVRARVVCHDNFSGGNSTDHGGIINGTGSSSYRCNSVESVTSGRGQYYSGTKWVNLPH